MKEACATTYSSLEKKILLFNLRGKGGKIVNGGKESCRREREKKLERRGKVIKQKLTLHCKAIILQ